jgi:hypothetical protein
MVFVYDNHLRANIILVPVRQCLLMFNMIQRIWLGQDGDTKNWYSSEQCLWSDRLVTQLYLLFGQVAWQCC